MLPLEHAAILSTFIKLPFAIKTFVLSIFEWPLKTGFTVTKLFRGIFYFVFIRKNNYHTQCHFLLRPFQGFWRTMGKMQKQINGERFSELRGEL